MAIYKAIGVMSGTSLDGIDLAYVEFMEIGSQWSFHLRTYKSIPYSKKWQQRLSGLMSTSSLDFVNVTIALANASLEASI